MFHTGCWKADQRHVCTVGIGCPHRCTDFRYAERVGLNWTDISWHGSSFDVPVGVVGPLIQLTINQKSKAWICIFLDFAFVIKIVVLLVLEKDLKNMINNATFDNLLTVFGLLTMLLPFPHRGCWGPPGAHTTANWSEQSSICKNQPQSCKAVPVASPSPPAKASGFPAVDYHFVSSLSMYVYIYIHTYWYIYIYIAKPYGYIQIRMGRPCLTTAVAPFDLLLKLSAPTHLNWSHDWRGQGVRVNCRIKWHPRISWWNKGWKKSHSSKFLNFNFFLTSCFPWDPDTCLWSWIPALRAISSVLSCQHAAWGYPIHQTVSTSPKQSHDAIPHCPWLSWGSLLTWLDCTPNAACSFPSVFP